MKPVSFNEASIHQCSLPFTVQGKKGEQTHDQCAGNFTAFISIAVCSPPPLTAPPLCPGHFDTHHLSQDWTGDLSITVGIVVREQLQGHSLETPNLNHSIVALAVCLGSLSCWKVISSLLQTNRFSSKIVLYLAPSIFPSTLTSFPVPAEEKHPHHMMLPPPCFTVGMVCSG